VFVIVPELVIVPKSLVILLPLPPILFVIVPALVNVPE